MQAEGSRWVLVVGLAGPLACGGEARHNAEPGPSLTVGGTLDGAGASATTWSDATTVTLGATVTTANSTGSVAGTSEATAVSVTSGAASSLGGAGGTSQSSGGAVDASAGGASVSAGGVGGGVQPSCTNPDEIEVGGVPTGFYACDEGHEVRGAQVTCPNLLPPKGEGGAAGAGAECTSHADCPGLGYCGSAGPFGPWCIEGCQTDADCGPGYVCRCGDPIGVCSEATCTTNEDCEAGSFCAGVLDPICVDSHRYACQSAADECQSDSDCNQDGRGGWCTLLDGVRRCEMLRPCR